ncbi:MAG TPA: hypothetical protein VH684_06335 [Xanthobacteraceae bacterium]|jgi:hypothetical protein
MAAVAISFVALVLYSDRSRAESVDFLAPNWGANFITCARAKKPVPLRAAAPDGNVTAHGIITCRDQGDSYVYAVDYMNFALSPTTQWKSAHFEWFGSGAQRQGPNGRNDWYFDEAKPINVKIDASRPRASISNVSFSVPKAVLAQARGFGFYAVGGGIFWPILLVSRDYAPDGQTSAPSTSTPLPSLKLPIAADGAQTAASNAAPSQAAPPQTVPPIERPDWGTGFPSCAGSRNPMPLKAATLDNDTVLGNGIVTCTDAGDAFIYAVDYLNFSLSPASKWTSAHLEWFGCGAQRAGANGQDDWIFEETKPIKLEIKAGVERVSITQISCRVPKSVLKNARGFGFYVVGGGVLWSILLL